MAGYGFGEELAAARRRNGYSIQQVSDALRIRPDIIRAIEMEDFAKMPAKGFARNQASAYARFLELDSAAITQAFLSAYSDFERTASTIGYVTNYQQPTNDRAYATARRAQRMQEEASHQYGLRSSSSRSRQQRSSSRQRSDDQQRHGDGAPSRRRSGQRGSNNRSTSRRNQGAGNSRSKQAARDRDRDERDSRNSRDLSKDRYAAPKRTRGRRTGGSVVGSAGFRPGGRSSGLRRIIALALVAIVVIIVVVFLLNRCQPNTTPSLADNGSVQVTGGSTVVASTVDSATAAAVTAVPEIRTGGVVGESFKLKIEVAEGASWVQVAVDGTTPTAEEANGPTDYEYKVTNSASVSVGNPGIITVYVNGKETEINVSAQGLGTLNASIQDGQVITDSPGASTTD